ncbi:MAG: hypothetical protein Q8N31_22860 [Reyranella sp.]|nr:hypothetical protein [Reyranella sp.]MDP3162863.1 hypothetical protein [Reyranella sp.]
MGALGHFLERQGIATTGISLVREHTETIRPPRALWVTFELGRPLGIPDDPGFQRRVLRAAAELLDRTDGPLIADYPENVAEATDFTGWACPINLAPASVDTLAAEIDRLATWHDQAVARTGRTTIGVSGLDMPAAGALLSSALQGDLPMAQALKEAVDDLRAYYLESASAFPDPGSPAMRKAWLWDETRFGKALLDLQPKLAASADPQHKILANLTLIPATERHRLAKT